MSPTFGLLSLLLLFAPTVMSGPPMKTRATAFSEAKPGCPTQCGNLAIPYPFGIGQNCAINAHFRLLCDNSTDPPKTFIPYPIVNNKTEVLNISASQIQVRNKMVSNCHQPPDQENVVNRTLMIVFVDRSPYTFSTSANKFTTIWCNSMGLVVGFGGVVVGEWGTECGTYCEKEEDVIGGYCPSVGCCQSFIPKGLKSLAINLGAFDINVTAPGLASACSYVFLDGEDKFVFQGASDLLDPSFANRTLETVPIVLDWQIGNLTCAEAKLNLSSFFCQQNSTCIDSDTGNGGYRCSCLPGYEGNSYLSPGCTDVDECADKNSNNCSNICINTPGSYFCSCPPGYTGDGFRNGTSCFLKPSLLGLKLGLGLSLGALIMVIGTTWLFFMKRKRRLIKLSEQFFKQNGGLLLEKQLSSDKQAGIEGTKIFSIKELENATKKFSEENILGKGGYGTVYKGLLPDDRVIAIKRSKTVDQTQIEQFINEVVILTRINHRNVVQLLGCCLETEVPILVYEFIPNGTLYDHIHSKKSSPSWLSWRNCLRIAVEAAEALAYLHSASSRPVIHRDVKSTNILLDENYAAKISDFGASRLVPLNYTQISTLVQGTLGYLDPEYFFSSQLTEKSDVYSFGVVVAELLTRQKPIPSDRENLATNFVRYMRENRVIEIIDPELVNEASKEQIISVAGLVRKCLSMKGEDRPTMKDVAIELERLRKELIVEQGDLYPVPFDHLIAEGSSTLDYSF